MGLMELAGKKQHLLLSQVHYEGAGLEHLQVGREQLFQYRMLVLLLVTYLCVTMLVSLSLSGM